MIHSVESLRHTVASHRHNIIGSCVVLSIMAAIIIILFIVCASHSPSGQLLCKSFSLGHIIGYGITLLSISLSPLLIKDAVSDWQSMHESKLELRFRME